MFEREDIRPINCPVVGQRLRITHDSAYGYVVLPVTKLSVKIWLKAGF